MDLEMVDCSKNELQDNRNALRTANERHTGKLNGKRTKSPRIYWKLETEEERLRRLEKTRLRNRLYMEKCPQKRQETRKRCNDRWLMRRTLNETLEERQRRLEKLKNYYRMRRDNMTAEELAEVRRKDRERWNMQTEVQRLKRAEAQQKTQKKKQNETLEEREKRLARNRQYYRRRVEKNKLNTSNISGTHEQASNESTGQSLQSNVDKGLPSAKSSKISAKNKKRQRLEKEPVSNQQELGDVLRNVYHLEEDDQLAKKWGLKKLLVVLERFDLTVTGNKSGSPDEISVNQKNCELKKWNLRPLVVRLERVDIAKVQKEIKAGSSISTY